MENLVQNPRLIPTNNLKENNSINSVVFQEHFPINSVNVNTSQVEFVVPANSNGLIDLKGSYIVNGCALTDLEGNNVLQDYTTQANRGFKENLGDTLWKDVKIFINGVEVQDTHPNLYPQSAFYKRALDDQGGNGTSVSYAKANPLGGGDVEIRAPGTRYSGWKGVEALNLAGDCEAGNNATTNAELVDLPEQRAYDIIRRVQTDSGRMLNPLEVITKLQDGIFNQPFFLPPNCDIRILLTKSNPEQLTYDNFDDITDITATLTSSILYIKRAYPVPSAMEMFNRSLALSPMEYNIKYTRTTQRTITQGTTSIQETNLLNGVVPDRVIVAFVPSSTISGAKRLSPYVSGPRYNQAYNNQITSIYVNANGRQYPQRQYNFGTGAGGLQGNARINGARAYMDYVNAWAEDNDVFPQDSPPISFDNWCNNYTFYAFDLRNDKLNENGYTTDLNNRGSIEVLATQVNENTGVLVGTTMLVVGITNAKVIIDANRNVSKDGF